MTTDATTPLAVHDAASWDAVEPVLAELSEREIADADAAAAWMIERGEIEATIDEAGSLIYINMTCDTGDEEAASTYRAYLEGFVPKIKPVNFALNRKQAELCARFELTIGRHEVIARDTTADVQLFRDENVPLETELSTLGQDYQTINGAMSVDFDGQMRTMPQMGPYLERTDRSVRESAYRAIVSRRLQDADKIDDLYTKQIGLRHTVAKNAGFDDFIGYTFKAKHRFDYGPEHCRAFHDAVEKEVMPLAATLDAQRKADLGVDELRPWDLAVDPKGREPLRPFDGGADLVSKTRAVMRALDPKLSELFESMGDGSNDRGVRTGANLDLDSRSGKAPGGYQAMLHARREPFIFMNAAGLHRDVETMVHEAGHAFHSMLCSDETLYHYREYPIEIAEVASMAMELLTMQHWGVEGGFYPDAGNLARAQRKQLEGSVLTLAWVATIDAFQHWVYANPGHSPADRRAAWLDLESRFGVRSSRVSWPEDLTEWQGRTWHAQLHLFEVPFYYIEYGIAQLGALGLWLKSLEEGEAAALEAYRAALRLGGSRPLPELFGAAGLAFDFGAETVGRLVERVSVELAKLPS
ncbi:MAG: M3 family oligoendopeptidase [Planctomycetota bacterium]